MVLFVLEITGKADGPCRTQPSGVNSASTGKTSGVPVGHCSAPGAEDSNAAYVPAPGGWFLYAVLGTLESITSQASGHSLCQTTMLPQPSTAMTMGKHT